MSDPSTPTLRIFGALISQPTRSVRALLELGGVPYEFVNVELQSTTPELLAANPTGLVPALVEGDFKLGEAAAIMQYIADSRGLEAYWPSDHKKKASIAFWLHWNHSHTRKITMDVLRPIALFGNRVKPATFKAVTEYIQFIEDHFARHPGQAFLTGDSLTLADLFIAPEIDQMGPDAINLLDLTPFPRVTAWLAALRTFEGYVKGSFTPLQQALAASAAKRAADATASPDDITLEGPFIIPKHTLATVYQRNLARGETFADILEVARVPLPAPEPGQVVIRVQLAAINPSDVGVLTSDEYRKASGAIPTRLGNEGCGVVVGAAEGDAAGQALVGKRVAFVAKGCYAKFVIGAVATCIPLPDDVPFDKATSVFVNPLTVLNFIDIAESKGVKAIVHTAGGGALGKMLIRAGKRHGVDVIAVIRSAAKADELRALGAAAVVVTSTPAWKEELTKLCEEKNATLAFDAVGGRMVGDLHDCLPANKGASIYVYGALSAEPVTIPNSTRLLLSDTIITGLYLSSWLAKLTPEKKSRAFGEIMTFLTTDFATHVKAKYPLKAAAAALADYLSSMSDGKVCIAPQA